MKPQHINYEDLNARQKERYNFQKIAGLLADYGFACLKLDDDWQGADFLAQHFDGKTFKKVQLKGRLHFDKKYIGKEIFIAFPYKKDWYMVQHDSMLKIFLDTYKDAMAKSESWLKKGVYNWNVLSPKILRLIKEFKLTPIEQNYE